MAKRTKSYGLNNPLQDVFPGPVISTRVPTTNDTNYELGQEWVNTSTNQVWHLTSVVSSSATWSLSSPGSSDVDTLTGDSGGAISPAAGNITLAGGTNVTTVGAGSTITFNLDAAITLVTSVTSPLYTSGAGVDVDIEAPTGQDIIMKMGDNAGANKVSFTDSDDAEVFSIDSNGSLGTFSGLTVTGAFTQTAGVVSISEDNSANAVGIANGTTARAIDIGSSAAAHTITMGSVTGAASLDLLAGTGNFTLTGAATTTMTIGTGLTSGTITIGATGNTGTMTISNSTSAQTVDIANADGKKTINIGDGVDGNDIDIGNGINTSAQTIEIGNGAAAANSTISLLSGAATAGTQTLNLANGASGVNNTVNVLSGVGTGGAGVLNLANNTRVTTVDIADIAPAAARTINVCGGDSAQNDTFNLMTGNPSANAQTVNILSGTPSGGTQVANILTQVGQAGTINIATGAAMANAINVGGTGACVIAVGNTQTGGSVAIGDAMTTGTIDIGGSGAQTGIITVAGGTGAQTINIANSTGGKTITLASGAGANTVTIGSTNSTSALTLQAGTGNITMTGTVESLTAKQVNNSGFNLTLLSSPTTCTAANTGGVATGAGGDINMLGLAEGLIMEQFMIGTQTIIKPVMNASGLLISLDLTATDGVEYNFGAARTLSEFAFTTNTSDAFFFEAELTIADISGGNPYFIGFRKAEANNATFGSYTDYYAIGINTGTSATNITLASEKNGAGQTLQDSTDAWPGGDGGTAKLRVLVSSTGVVTATIDGVAPSAPLAFTFDAGDVVCPFIHLVHGAAAPGAVNLVSMTGGFQ